MIGKSQTTTQPCIWTGIHQNKSSTPPIARYAKSMKHGKQSGWQKRKQWKFQK